MRIALASPDRQLIQGACLEIVRRYRAAGYSKEAASEQASAFASRFTGQTTDQWQPLAANCNEAADFEATLASIADVIG